MLRWIYARAPCIMCGKFDECECHSFMRSYLRQQSLNLNERWEWSPENHRCVPHQEHNEIKTWMLISRRIGMDKNVAKIINIYISGFYC